MQEFFIIFPGCIYVRDAIYNWCGFVVMLNLKKKDN